ncbi:hypothetical protein EYV94_17800 [Puteibacter caeruleilacunae]|nr:hypothetical protein EYV94_17800 [Puteibacter caeruleilacunae]
MENNLMNRLVEETFEEFSYYSDKRDESLRKILKIAARDVSISTNENIAYKRNKTLGQDEEYIDYHGMNCFPCFIIGNILRKEWLPEIDGISGKTDDGIDIPTFCWGLTCVVYEEALNCIRLDQLRFGKMFNFTEKEEELSTMFSRLNNLSKQTSNEIIYWNNMKRVYDVYFGFMLAIVDDVEVEDMEIPIKLAMDIKHFKMLEKGESSKIKLPDISSYRKQLQGVATYLHVIRNNNMTSYANEEKVDCPFHKKIDFKHFPYTYLLGIAEAINPSNVYEDFDLKQFQNILFEVKGKSIVLSVKWDADLDPEPLYCSVLELEEWFDVTVRVNQKRRSVAIIRNEDFSNVEKQR